MENENENENERERVPSPRGISLERDLMTLLTDEKTLQKFHDIILKCSDNNVTIRAYKNILLARSDVFNKLILSSPNQSKREQREQIDFTGSNASIPPINSIAMKVVLEFLYTGKENLSNNYLVEVYHAAIYFELIELQNSIIKFTEIALENEDDEFGKNLLSEFVEKFTLEAENENEMSKLLVEWVARIQLFPADYADSLSLKGLQYLLTKTSQPEKPFLTYELDLFEYTAIKTKQAVLKEANEARIEMDPYSEDYEQGVRDRLKPLLPLIDLHRIEKDIIIKKIEPLKIFLLEKIVDTYRFMLGNPEMQYIRGIPLFKWKNPNPNDDRIRISNRRKTVEDCSIRTSNTVSVIGNFSIKGLGIYRWDIVIEELGETIYIGICNNERFDRSNNGWVLGSDGYFYYENTSVWCGYDYVLKKNDVVSVTVNMNAKNCSFSVNNRGGSTHSIPSPPNVFYPCAKVGKDCTLTLNIR